MRQTLSRKRRQFETRFSAQLAPVDRRALWRRALWIAAVLCIVAAGWFFLYAPYWQIRTVTVEGQHFVTEAQVRAAVPAEGVNIFRYNTGQSFTTLQQLPAVYSVRIIRRLPHTLGVVLVEREPQLIWQTTQQNYDVDLTGVAFRIVPPGEDTTGLFIVKDMANVHVELGEHAVPSRFMSAYAAIVDQLPALYPDQIDHMEVGDTVYDFDIVLKDGRRVRFNVLSDIAAQLADLKRIADKRPDLFSRAVIDLRVDRWAFIK